MTKIQVRIIIGMTILVVLTWLFANSIPKPLFKPVYSSIVEDQNGVLLSARIARDGQWRFPQSDSLPNKYVQALLTFEDQYFFQHPGVNPLAIGRALWQNIKSQDRVSGASTLSMQTIRMAEGNSKRTTFRKILEMIQAVRLEVAYSKKDILLYYAAHAPFGGNVVGLETASWRYYGRAPDQLSWAETCALAVLPNSPSLIRPGKNEKLFKAKRDRLLKRLQKRKIIDEETYELSKDEPLPLRPKPIPNLAPHLLQKFATEDGEGKRWQSTIQSSLQIELKKLVDTYHQAFHQTEIHNIGLIVVEVESGEVAAYIGNSECPDPSSGSYVDMITAPRSTGSVLKPFLYHEMLKNGLILPHALISDIPTEIAGYAPKNFNETFDGMVPANEALARSLNIPAVRMLRSFGIGRFHSYLQKLGLNDIDKSPDHYGLSLILGGAESNLWDLSNAYLQMARSMGKQKYYRSISHRQVVKKNDQISSQLFQETALWYTLQALLEVNRPLNEEGWEQFNSNSPVAFKTGTSFGHRDAWAIGLTPKYVVGVWVGNADGEGRPELTGLSVAAPILFRTFNKLPSSEWFQQDEQAFVKREICEMSGHLAGKYCENKSHQLMGTWADRTDICPYHKLVFLNKELNKQVHAGCYSTHDMVVKSWFVLPPVQEWYYRQRNPLYRILPPLAAECVVESGEPMEMIYPDRNAKLVVPRELDGSKGYIVFELAHKHPSQKVFWHLNNSYYATTEHQHKLQMQPKLGKHVLNLVDEEGNSLDCPFEIVE
jgi:penicillin-binding protein 1C